MNAADEPQQVERERCKRGLVEVTQVEIRESVVALVDTEVFQVQVAAHQQRRRGREHGVAGQTLVEEVAGAAVERVGIGAQQPELAPQHLGIASTVVVENGLRNALGRRHGSREQTMDRWTIDCKSRQGLIGTVPTGLLAGQGASRSTLPAMPH